MRALFLISPVVFAFLALSAEAQPVASIPKPVIITYPDGTAEKYELEYQANLQTRVTQNGSAAKPFQGKFIDDRRCSWTIATTITRHLYLINREGQKFQKGDPVQVTNASSGGQSAGFSLSNLQGQNCGTVRNKINSQEATAKTKINDALPQIVSDDLAKSLADLKTSFPTATIKLGQ